MRDQVYGTAAIPIINRNLWVGNITTNNRRMTHGQLKICFGREGCDKSYGWVEGKWN